MRSSSSATAAMFFVLLACSVAWVAAEAPDKLQFASCSQTSSYRDKRTFTQRYCHLAMDGNRNRHMHTIPGCSLTQQRPNQMWYGHFAEPVLLKAVQIWSRKAASHQSSNILVEASDGVSWHRCGVVSGLYTKITVRCKIMNARVLRIRKLNDDYLSLCEVEAYTSLQERQTNFEMKRAQFSSCSQSSDFNDKPFGILRSCQLAMDGSFERREHNLPGCASTKNGQLGVWHGFFDHPIHLAAVGIWSREDLTEQSMNILVEAFDGKMWHRCGHIKSPYAYALLKCDHQNVHSLRIRRSDSYILTLCEVEPFAVKPSKA